MRRIYLLVAVLLLVPATVTANGRFPTSVNVHARPGDADDIYLALTFGLLVSDDDGANFYWLCENNIGYAGTFDPKYAIASDGTIYATTYDGLRVSRDGGCSFETATEGAAPGPDRIAGMWADAIDIDSAGAVWVGTAESGQSNAVFRSTDRGETFTRIGLSSDTMWWKSLLVAPSDDQRIYVSGYQVAPEPEIQLHRSNDGGTTFTPLPATGIELSPNGGYVTFEAVDPVSPDVVFVKSWDVTRGGGDRIYRSSDGGMTWAAVLDSTETIRDVVIRADGEVLAATVGDGLYRSDDGGQSFVRELPAPAMACLTERGDGTLFACGANWDPDNFTLARSVDGSTWTSPFRFHQMAGPLSCARGTVQYDVCELQIWPSIREQFGVTGPVDAGPGADAGPAAEGGGGCCDSRGAADASLLLGLALLGPLVRRRGRAGAAR